MEPHRVCADAQWVWTAAVAVNVGINCSWKAV